jgi:hypothetical protein
MDKNLDEAIRLMKNAVRNGPDWVENELSAMLWERGLPEDYVELKILSESLISKGNIFGYIRLSRMYRDGKGVKKDLDEAIRLMKNAVDKGIPDWGKREYISVLLERCNPEDCNEILNYDGGKIQDFVNFQISKLSISGMIGGLGPKTIYKKSQKHCYSNPSIKATFQLNRRLLEYQHYCLCITDSNLNMIFSSCLQYNIRPDFILCTDMECNFPFAKTIREEDVVNSKFTAFITTSDNIPYGIEDTDIFLVDHVDKQSSFLSSNDKCNDVGCKIVIKDKQPFENNKYADYSEANKSGHLVVLRDHGFILIKPEDLIEKYQIGAKIYESLRPDIKWVFSRWDNIGDVFKIASLIKEFKIHTHNKSVGVIVRDRLAGISSLFHSIDEELNLGSKNYDALKLYIEYNLAYNDKLWYCSPEWSPFFGYTRTVPGTYLIQRPRESYDLRKESDRFKKWMNVPSSSLFEKIHTVDDGDSGKILLNPFGGWIYHNFKSIKDEVWDLFNEISSRCVEEGLSVYTNYNKEGKVLRESTMYEGSIIDLAKEIREFSDIVSVCTGLTDVVALTDCNLHIIYPDEGWAKEFSKKNLYERENIFEYTLGQGLSDSELIISNIVEKLIRNN